MRLKKARGKPGSNVKGPKSFIDGDLIAFAVASASDGKYYTIETIEGKYPLIKDVKKAFKEAGVEYDRKIVHEAYEPDPIENCLYSVKHMTEDIIVGCGNGKYRIFLTGKDNYRYKIATIRPYKGNRKGKRKPHHLQDCRNYLIRRFNAEVIDGAEADDAMGIAQMEAMDGGQESVIASIDKDMDCIPGLHYRWPCFGKPGKMYFISQVEANRHFYKQLLIGDSTDNIQGAPGIGGEGKAVKALDEIEDAREMALHVYGEYATIEMGLRCTTSYKDVLALAYDKFIENGRLVWIQRKRGELWEPPPKKES